MTPEARAREFIRFIAACRSLVVPHERGRRQRYRMAPSADAGVGQALHGTPAFGVNILYYTAMWRAPASSNLFEQQSSPRGAAAAALTLNIFNNRGAYIARLCNNLHSLYIAGGGRFAEASPAMSSPCARSIRAADSCTPASAVL